MSVRLIDCNAYIDEINERIDASIKWGCNAIADGNSEIKLRAEQAVATFCEASLTAKKMPAIDAVEVIRCKDCKYWHREIHNGIEYFNFSLCDLSHYGDGHNFYCADGERRTDDER